MLDIIKETGAYIVIVKPFGMESEHEVPEALAAQCGGHAADYYCVHRLDRAAGGLIVYARTKSAAAALTEQMTKNDETVRSLDRSNSSENIRDCNKNKSEETEISKHLEISPDKAFQKQYYAVVSGVPKEPAGILRDLLFRDRQKQKMFTVKRMRKGVKESVLDYRTLDIHPFYPSSLPEGSPQLAPPEGRSWPDPPKNRPQPNPSKKEYPTATTPAQASEAVSLVDIRLHTGRFHQIRAQFAGRGMPLAGDRKYGSRIKAPYVALFCHSLRFRDPDTDGIILCKAAPPDTFPWSLFRQTGSQDPK